ncbi:conserved hypothetical protein [Gammaproteobacteria bacterium]
MLRSIQGILEPSGQVRFQEKVAIGHSIPVLVTLLDSADEESASFDHAINTEKGQVADALALLSSPAFVDLPPGNPAAMARVIQENREAWGE